MNPRTSLKQMRLLEAGWDSYQGKPIAPRAIDKAQLLLDVLPGEGWAAVPCSDGSVMLEQHRDGLDIEISITAAATAQETSVCPACKGTRVVHGGFPCDVCSTANR